PDLLDAEQKDKFLPGLKEHVQLQLRLRHHADMDTILFETLVSLAQKIDTIYFTSKNRNATAYRPSPRPAPTPSGPTPMDIDSTKATNNKKKNGNPNNKPSNGPRAPLTEKQRKYLMANQGCFYCRKANAGHQVRNCPEKLAADKVKKANVNNTTTSSDNKSSNPASGDGSTQN
ncbi:hypothetical protein HK104_003702, partial [Borealophlyctis nickersoniae]